MKRQTYLKQIQQAFRSHPIVALLGPRQCGKTTLAHMYAEQQEKKISVTRFDLEDPVDLARLGAPKSILESLEGLVIIDEIQRIRDLFPILRALVDRASNKTRFLILGSASRELIQQSSETLAGRVAHLELTPFSFTEVPELERLWLRGGFPRSYLAKSPTDSWVWRQNYIKTFLEQDIPNLGIQIPAITLRRFWMMLVHYHGNIFNASEIGRSLGVSDTTAKRYLDILVGTFMIRYLAPWHENIGKRQVKSANF
jgi:predicted AAA+ superfamily ATPase